MASETRKLSLSCATANLNGNKKKPANPSGSGDTPKPSEVRFRLIRDCLEANQVLFLQEVTITKKIQTHLSATHHIEIPPNPYQNKIPEVGILLSKKAFDVEETLSSETLKPDIDTLNKTKDSKLDSGRLIAVSSVHKATSLRFLFVSYHGRKTNQDEAAEICRTLMTFCENLKEREGADRLLLGGDFNFPKKHFEDQVLPEFNTYQALDFIREGTGRDYIVCDRDVNNTIERYEFEETEDLSVYFDHYPVVAKLMMYKLKRLSSRTTTNKGKLMRFMPLDHHFNNSKADSTVEPIIVRPPMKRLSRGSKKQDSGRKPIKSYFKTK